MEIAQGTRLQVYKNLITGTWSAKAKIPHPKTGKLVWRKVWGGSAIVLDNVAAKVSVKGAARIRRLSRRNVVAWIEGDFRSFDGDITGSKPTAIHYNPYRRDDFHSLDGIGFDTAKTAIFPADSASFLAIL
jgi:hypothetical protein